MLQVGLKEPVITDVQVLTSRLTVPSPPICKYLVTPKNAVKNEQDTSLPWSNSSATAPKCWVKLSLINLPSINCQPGCVNFELLHYMCGQGSFNAHADSNLKKF